MTLGELVAIIGTVELIILVLVLTAMLVGGAPPARLGGESREPERASPSRERLRRLARIARIAG